MSIRFDETRRGQKYYDHDVPRIADALEQVVRLLKPQEQERPFCSHSACEEYASTLCTDHARELVTVWVIHDEDGDHYVADSIVSVKKFYLDQIEDHEGSDGDRQRLASWLDSGGRSAFSMFGWRCVMTKVL